MEVRVFRRVPWSLGRDGLCAGLKIPRTRSKSSRFHQKRGVCSSDGRAPGCGSGGRGLDSLQTHTKGDIAQRESIGLLIRGPEVQILLSRKTLGWRSGQRTGLQNRYPPVRIRPWAQNAVLAQLAEQLICNEQVVGSIPADSSRIFCIFAPSNTKWIWQ